jgi:two-component system, chemotaxis family, protein-glutamate methylesterase/glutaminase
MTVEASARLSAKGRNIIVVGASAGGVNTLDLLVGQLPTGLPASIFIVQHMAPHNSGAALLRRLNRHTAFDAKLARDGERFAPGRIYIAPPDGHLLLKKDKLLVARGARESRHRPGIDPLFRSAAVAHGARAIGVVLTGMLDDGTAGLMAIKRCGGVTVVQDPRDAAYPGMPLSALDNVDVDFCVSIAEMGPLLATLVSQPHGKNKAVPQDVRTEAAIAERVLSSRPGGNAPALLASQSEKIEEMLWISLRMFEERKNLLFRMTKRGGHSTLMSATRRRARETQGYIDRIRGLLLGSGPHDSADRLIYVRALMAEPRRAKSAR